MNAAAWYVFDGASPHGPMSRAEVVQFVGRFPDRDDVAVWRPGLDGWQPVGQLFDIGAPTRLVSAPVDISSTRRYSIYGVYFGVSVLICDYLFEWRGAKYAPWRGNGVTENIGYIVGSLTTCVVVAFIVGWIVDFATRKSRRKSVRDRSTFEQPEIIVEVPLDPNRRKNFIARFWRGEYSLGISYWLFGLIGNIAVAVLVSVIALLFRIGNGYEPVAILGFLVCVWLAILAYSVWIVFGTWRSANRHIARRQSIGKRAGWAVAAKISLSLGLFSSVGVFSTAGWPQLVETSRIVFLDDPDVPAYSIRVMRNGTEAEISGGFKFGLTDDYIKVLKASRQIKTVHLDSVGGRIGEAIKLNAVLKAHGVDTYVSNGCFSACTIAFAAGRNRFLRKGATLGFHAPAFAGMQTLSLEDVTADQKRLFIAAGFDKSFVDKALSTPNSDIWEPSAEVLSTAHVITGLSDGSEFALSGLGGDATKAELGDILIRALPLVQTLKDRFPKHYDAILSTYYHDYIDGETEAESIAGARAKMLSIISRLRPLADDAVLSDLGGVYADEYLALAAKNPAACYRYAAAGGAKTRFVADLPASLVDRENEINRRIVDSAKERQDSAAPVIADLWKKLAYQLAAKGVGKDKFNLLTSDSVGPARYKDYCQATVTFYREIARLPQREAAIIMRSIFAEK
ncbi:MAG TPA: GYF domain-containing protein [Bradyrhizobium sp.]|uniref:GYF domain-containing protein n=1 Tax=Bradyrhizobium sp. TaxID=376 RepID=UPI002B48AD63|nr:GYF domain-containing protein [Bradyrhizobium sp.]HKO69647.1 GYF domain-containing protein [Bradyrhizobium sp.]